MPLRAAMRWLVICLLVSLAALLFAAAGVARHIWLQRGALRAEPTAEPGQELEPPLDTVEGTKVGSEV
jgi:hypothetical protein